MQIVVLRGKASDITFMYNLNNSTVTSWLHRFKGAIQDALLKRTISFIDVAFLQAICAAYRGAFIIFLHMAAQIYIPVCMQKTT